MTSSPDVIEPFQGGSCWLHGWWRSTAQEQCGVGHEDPDSRDIPRVGFVEKLLVGMGHPIGKWVASASIVAAALVWWTNTPPTSSHK